MKNILILGSTGKVGQLLTKKLLEKKYFVTALVRNPNKLTIHSSNLKIIQGDVSISKDLAIALNNVDAVISVLGHGFRTPFPIQERTMEVLIPAMEDKKIKRLITITGSDLLVEGDEYPLYAKLQRKLFSMVDPYRMNDAVNQQKILEKSNLDWTVIRTPVHSNAKRTRANITNKKPYLWQTIARATVVEFIADCIESSDYIRKSPIIA